MVTKALPAKTPPATARPAAAITQYSSTGNKNFRARITFKSGAQQEFLVQATATNAFEMMRVAFGKSVAGTGPHYGLYAVPSTGNVALDWREVASFYDWVD